jgi:hypothetical protein
MAGLDSREPTAAHRPKSRAHVVVFVLNVHHRNRGLSLHSSILNIRGPPDSVRLAVLHARSPPRYDPGLLRTIRRRTGQRSMQLALCAGIVRNKTRDSRWKCSFDATSYSKAPSERSLE